MENSSTRIAGEAAAVPQGQAPWTYEVAFSRNLGLISPEEQQRLRTSCIAVAGMGGVGGVHLITLARLGIGRFRIADPDHFDVPNFNRQYGAEVSTLGREKAEVMAEKAKAINPDIDLQIYTEAITPLNVGEFLEGVDIFLDGVDFFAIGARRLLFAEARRRGIWAITAGPVGFSTAWIVFDPKGMSFDSYFDLHDEMGPLDQVCALAAGLAPKGTHLPYMDLSRVRRETGAAPSAGLACQLCSGVAAAEVLKLLLGRRPIRPAPRYYQFDAYRTIFRTGKLRFGNRSILQRLKRRWIRNLLQGK